MAADEALTRLATEPVLRVYRWDRPSVSFGYFGEFAGVVERWAGRNPVRRWTGGGEVPHGEDFTYSLFVPRDDPFASIPVGESYRQIHTALASCISGASLAAEDSAQNPACFARPVISDILVNAQKVGGAAQRRGRFGLLHQGSVQGTEILTDLDTAFAAALAREVAFLQPSKEFRAETERLVAERYGTDAWMKRR